MESPIEGRMIRYKMLQISAVAPNGDERVHRSLHESLIAGAHADVIANASGVVDRVFRG